MKDDATLNAVIKNNTQRLRQLTSRPPRPKRAGRGNRFGNQYKPSIYAPDVIRLVHAHVDQERIVYHGAQPILEMRTNVPYFTFTEHYDGQTNQSALCSAGPWADFKDKRNPCFGCDIFWATVQRGDRGGLKSSRMSRVSKDAFSLVDYGVYHKMASLDRSTGQVRTNATTGEAYFSWEKCKGMGCDGCRAGVETKQGDARHWAVNYTYMNVLSDADTAIGNSCRVCCNRDCIRGLAWFCPQCNNTVIDLATTTLNWEEFKHITSNQYMCQCGYNGFLEEIYECPSCAAVGKQGIRATLFDVDIQLKAVETGQNNNKVLQILGWSNPCPVNPAYAKLAEKPLDLAGIYAPTGLDLQARVFNYKPQPVPSAPSAPSAGAPPPSFVPPSHPQAVQPPSFPVPATAMSSLYPPRQS